MKWTIISPLMGFHVEFDEDHQPKVRKQPKACAFCWRCVPIKPDQLYHSWRRVWRRHSLYIRSSLM